MLKDYCVICKSLNSDIFEVFVAYKKGEQHVVSIKKVNKKLCDENSISMLKETFFEKRYIEEFESDDFLIRTERVKMDDSGIMNCLKSNGEGIVFFNGSNLIFANKKYRDMMNKKVITYKIDEIETDDVSTYVKANIETMIKRGTKKLSSSNRFNCRNIEKKYSFDFLRIQDSFGDQFMVVCKDNTQWHAVQKTLAKVSQRLNAVMESSRSGVFEVEAKDLDSIWVSSDISSILGYDYDNRFIDRVKVNGVIHPDDLKGGIEKFKQDIIDRKVICKEVRIREKSGKYRWFSLVAYVINNKGDSEKIVGSITDIHDKLIASKNLKDSERALEEERETNKLITEFFNNISHDFKTPLNLITNSLKLLKNSIGEVYDDEKQTDRYFEIIQQNCYRLIKLVNNLLDISRIDSGFYSLSLSNGNIVNLIEDTTLSVKEYTKNRGIDLVFDTDVEEEVICFDNEKIERVMLNLLSNAIKFTEKGGRILVNLSKREEFMEIHIQDTGVGIPKGKIDGIFGRFHQAHEDSHRTAGTGIGLCLVKSLIEMHDGSIKLQSEEGKGTSIKFYLPIKKKCTDDTKEFMESKYDIDKVYVELSDVEIC